MKRSIFSTFALVWFGIIFTATADQSIKLKTKNVILITTDGLRWEDVFTGADPALLNKENGGVGNTNLIRKNFWRETPEARREAMMPFLWSVVAKQGQIFGNQNKGSVVQVTNGKNFSYPGYNEIFTGRGDERVNSNFKIPNANTNVLEWLHLKPAFRNRIAAFSSWDVMPFILNRDRSGFPVFGGFESLPAKRPNEREKFLNELIKETSPIWETELYDSFVFHGAFEHFKKEKPRVLYASFLETDAWGHGGRYDNVLQAAQRVDTYIRRFWETAQSMRQYRDKTTLLITTDHGRGVAPKGWKNHGKETPGSENIWVAVMGPDTPALQERMNVGRVTQGQVAATLAAFLGEDFRSFVPEAAPPIAGVFPETR